MKKETSELIKLTEETTIESLLQEISEKGFDEETYEIEVDETISGVAGRIYDNNITSYQLIVSNTPQGYELYIESPSGEYRSKSFADIIKLKEFMEENNVHFKTIRLEKIGSKFEPTEEVVEPTTIDEPYAVVLMGEDELVKEYFNTYEEAEAYYKEVKNTGEDAVICVTTDGDCYKDLDTDEVVFNKNNIVPFLTEKKNDTLYRVSIYQDLGNGYYKEFKGNNYESLDDAEFAIDDIIGEQEDMEGVFEDPTYSVALLYKKGKSWFDLETDELVEFE